MNAVEIKKDIYWIGALDPDLRLFDIVMYTPYGTTYNSYVIRGSEKTAIFETVKEKYYDGFLNRLNSANVNLEDVDYIILDHTEPDHTGSVSKILEAAPNVTLVGSEAALRFIKSITNKEFNSIAVKSGDTLTLGNKTIKFISAPFLHWPDSIFSYIEEGNLLITCDAFGCHYCNEHIFNDLNPNTEKYMEALKYYFNAIMGPFKPYVLKAIDKIKDLKINMICPSHGPILRDNPSRIIKLYKEWSVEKEKSFSEKYVVIPYVSAYGYTETLAKKIADGITASGDFKVDMYDVVNHDINKIMNNIEIADGIIFGSPTINGDALKPILEILMSLNPIIHGKKVAAAFGSYGWSGEAVDVIENRLKELRMNLMSPGLKVNFKPSEEELLSAYKFGESFSQKINSQLNKTNSPIKPSTSKKWKCLICGVIFDGAKPPETCPVCGAAAEQFVEIVESKVDIIKDKDETFIIIGNGAAGYYSAKAIRERNSKCKIKIISEESNLTYFRPQLSDYLSSSLPDNQFYLSPEQWYKENNIEVVLNVTVEAINPDEKNIVLKNGSTVKYDKLILANGSSSFVPLTPGVNKEGVFSLKYLSDATKIKNYISKSKNAVIIGGGLLGLEAAWEMKKCGLEVTVVEFMSRLLPRQLDDEGYNLFKKSISNCGVNIILGDSVEEILGEEKVTGVRLKSGKTISTDLALFSIGIRPNKNLGEKAGIASNKGIIVNDKMETSLKDIYACGDVCEYNERVYGNWPASVEMGTVAGSNAVGDEFYFTDFVSSVIFSSMDTELFSCGSFTSNSQSLSSQNPERNTYEKLFFENNKLVGAILIGDTKKSGKIMTAIQSGKTKTEILKENIII